MRLATLLISLLLTTAPTFAGTSNDALLDELNAFNDRFNTLTAERNMEEFLTLYSEKALWIAPSTAPAQGREEPRLMFQFLIDKEGQLTHTIDKLVISEDQSQAVMIGTAGVLVEQVGLDTTGTYLFVLERDADNNWEIATDMWHQHIKQ